MRDQALEARAVVRRYHEAWSSGRFSDAVELLAEDFDTAPIREAGLGA